MGSIKLQEMKGRNRKWRTTAHYAIQQLVLHLESSVIRSQLLFAPRGRRNPCGISRKARRSLGKEVLAQLVRWFQDLANREDSRIKPCMVVDPVLPGSKAIEGVRKGHNLRKGNAPLSEEYRTAARGNTGCWS